MARKSNVNRSAVKVTQMMDDATPFIPIQIYGDFQLLKTEDVQPKSSEHNCT